MALRYWYQIGHQSQRRRHRCEREHAQEVAPRDPAPAPPSAPEQDYRQHHHRGLRQQGQQEQAQRKKILRIADCGLRSAVRRARSLVVVRTNCVLPIAVRRVRCAVVVRTVVIKTQPSQDARQIERHRQGVLALGDPGHRLHRHRVHREQQTRQPCAGNPQPEQHPPEQHCARRVQQHVDQVIARRVRPPQTPLEPEHAGGQREIVRRRLGEPAAVKAVGGADQRVLGQEGVVVPDEPGAEGGHVGDQRRGDDD